MWTDATRAEAFRLIHSRTTWFWSVLFLPIITIVFGVIAAYVVKANTERLAQAADAPPELTAMLAGGPLNLGESLLANAAELAGPGLLLFVLIGAATIYAGEYRWETWRLLRPRSGRTELIVGKLLVVTSLAIAAMALLALASLISEAVRAFVFERSLAFSLSGDEVMALLGLWGLAVLRTAQFLMLSLLAAVVSRSLLAALFVPLTVGVAQFFVPNVMGMMGQAPDSWLTVLASPGHAVSLLQGFLAPDKVTLSGQGALIAKAWISLIGWIIVPLAGAILLFQRQDLSKE